MQSQGIAKLCAISGFTKHISWFQDYAFQYCLNYFTKKKKSSFISYNV